MADRRDTTWLQEGVEIANAEFQRQGEKIVNECIAVGKGMKDMESAPSVTVRQTSQYMLVQKVIQLSDVEDTATLEVAALEELSEAREVLDLTVNTNPDWSLLRDNDIVRVVAHNLDFTDLSLVVNILGRQPNEGKGAMRLVVEAI